jgi:hypothetical protein
MQLSHRNMSSWGKSEPVCKVNFEVMGLYIKLQFWNASRARQPTMAWQMHLVGSRRKERSERRFADWLLLPMQRILREP